MELVSATAAAADSSSPSKDCASASLLSVGSAASVEESSPEELSASPEMAESGSASFPEFEDLFAPELEASESCPESAEELLDEPARESEDSVFDDEVLDEVASCEFEPIPI